MSSIAPLRSHLLQALPAAEREALRPHLESVELIREADLSGLEGPRCVTEGAAYCRKLVGQA